MPFVSESQRRYLWANEPSVAQEFADKTPKGKKLPYHKKKKKKKSMAGKSAAELLHTLFTPRANILLEKLLK